MILLAQTRQADRDKAHVNIAKRSRSPVWNVRLSPSSRPLN
jgi:hypothetical protein